MTSSLAILTFIFGAAIASFASVIISRLHKKQKGSLLGRSECPNCHKQLPKRSLIPILSYIIQKGYCSTCEQKISPHYLFIELFFATTFTATFFKFLPHLHPENTLAFAIYLIIFALLGTIFFYDLKYQEIPDHFSLPAVIIALTYNLSFSTIPQIEILAGTAILAAFFAIQFILSKGKIIGGGDIRLGAVMGAFLGIKLGIAALALAYIAGGLFATYLLVSGRADRKTAIAFGPFLSAATILIALYGDQFLASYFALLT